MNDNTRTPLVSVVIPAFKGAFFEQMVRSVLDQTFRNFELIVVDDASPFDFSAILAKFGDTRITYHRNGQNLGGKNLSEAYRHACSFAKGKYIVLASDDDVYMPAYLERMVALAESNPGVSLFSCRVGHIDESGELRDAGVPVLPFE
ncbi:MAG: glycosyltransferase family 2 protein, partial [Kiritimatiellae bacterium]|nr:glycosyltransferase family 2 protein [Kiritimatiellia bacterium]